MSESPKQAAVSLLGGVFLLAVIGVIALIAGLLWVASHAGY